jgi:hypothetical protein
MLSTYRSLNFTPLCRFQELPDPFVSLIWTTQTIPQAPRTSQLMGLVRVVNLDDIPSFMSLSYVWGKKEHYEAHTIYCRPQGFSLDITEGCNSALIHLRKRYGSLTVWIDAICINQDDGDEKESQIPHMRLVYSLSESVFVWLGESSDNSNKAIRFLGDRSTAMPLPSEVLPWIKGRTLDGLRNHTISFKQWIHLILGSYTPYCVDLGLKSVTYYQKASQLTIISTKLVAVSR